MVSSARPPGPYQQDQRHRLELAWAVCSIRKLIKSVVVLAGVIWRGDSVIEGVPETLEMLRGLVRAWRCSGGGGDGGAVPELCTACEPSASYSKCSLQLRLLLAAMDQPLSLCHCATRAWWQYTSIQAAASVQAD